MEITTNITIGTHPRKAFTLIEMVIVTGVLMVVSVVITQIVLSSIRSSVKSESIREMKQNGDQAIDTITRMIQNASDIKNPSAASFCSAAPGTTKDSIMITNPDGYQTIFRCVEVDTIPRIASTAAYNDVAIVPTSEQILTAGQTKLVQATNKSSVGCAAMPLQFTCVLNGTSPETITVSFGLVPSRGSNTYVDQAFSRYTNTVVIRNQSGQ